MANLTKRGVLVFVSLLLLITASTTVALASPSGAGDGPFFPHPVELDRTAQFRDRVSSIEEYRVQKTRLLASSRGV